MSNTQRKPKCNEKQAQSHTIMKIKKRPYVCVCEWVYIDEKKPYDTRPNEWRRHTEAMSVQSYRISIYCSRYNKQAPFTSCTNIQTTIATVVRTTATTTTTTSATAVVPSSSLPTTTTATERSRGERARAVRVSCKAFLCMPFHTHTHKHFYIIFSHLNPFLRCCCRCSERK